MKYFAWTLATWLGACHGSHLGDDAGADARVQFSRCLFDGAPRDVTAADFESRIRTALRHGRYDFSVRGGACVRTLEEDPSRQGFVTAWNQLLPLAQATTPDEIALEQAIRHVGNAWRAMR